MTDLPRTLKELQRGIDEGLHHGAQLYVAHHGDCLADLGLGTVDGVKPMTPDSITLWLSCGKPITAIAVLQQLERGKLSLDAPVAHYWPAFAQNGKAGITVKHLLNHTCGIRTLEGILTMSAEHALEAITQMPLEADWSPGLKAGYHPLTSWLVLGKLLEIIGDRPIAQILDDQIFQPLEMKDCSLGIALERQTEVHQRLSMMHLSQDSTLIPNPIYNTPDRLAVASPGSNIRGAIRELGKVLAALLNQGTCPQTGHVLLEAATVDMMLSPARDPSLKDATFMTTMRWGLGISLHTEAHKFPKPYGFGPYASKPSFGHGGAQSGVMFADPAHDLIVCWTCNGQPREPVHQKRNQRINRSIYEDLGIASL